MTRDAKPVRVAIELTDEQAWAFAQFLKRSTFDDYRGRAVDKGETYAMIAAGEAIRKALADAGYAPR
ncbi:MAG: hypothetical protein WAO95_14015 [Burkholderiales bacterium]